MTVLRDALYNLHPESATSPEYAKGVLIGAMAALMEVGQFDFQRAIDETSPFLPSRVMKDAVPLEWRADFMRRGVKLA